MTALALRLPPTVRRQRPADVAALDRFVRGLSPASRFLRFHVGVRELSAPALQRMTHLDARCELALVATDADSGELLGEARYAPDDDDPCAREFAVVVADGAQRRGIGTRLLRGLLRHARQAGIARLYGDLIRDNAPMLALARKLGFAVRRHPRDARLQRVEIELTSGGTTAWM